MLEKNTTESVVHRKSGGIPEENTQQRRKSGLYWKAYEARRALRPSAVGRVSILICITNGVKIFWKPARSDSWVIWSERANSQEVGELKQENEQLKQLVAELSLKNRVLKKSLSGLE